MTSINTTYKINRFSYGIALFCFIFFMSCVNEIDRFIPERNIIPGEYQSVLSELDKEQYAGILDLDENLNIQFDDILVSVLSESIVDASGNLVSGKIDVELIKIKEAKEFIAYNIDLTDNLEDILNMNLAIQILLTQNGSPLFLKNGKNVRVFCGHEEKGSEVAYERSGDFETWSQSTVEFINESKELVIGGSGQMVNGVTALMPLNQWVGLFAKPVQDFKSTMCVDLNEGFADNNTVVYFVYQAVNSIQKIGFTSDSEKCSQNVDLPVEYEGTVVVLVDRENDYFELGFKNHTVSTVNQVSIIPVKQSAEFINTIIDGL